MKKIGIITMASLMGLGLAVGGMTQTAEAAKESIIEMKQAIRNERIQAKLEGIRQKAGEEVKNKVAEKVKAKEAKVAADKAAAEAKEAEAKKAAEQAAAEQAAAEQAAAAQAQAQPQAGNSDPGVDTTTGASQSGREIGERNREYGQQLSDPNLSQSDRQQIIQEKKAYNQSRR